METDIRLLKEEGIDGVVIGALNSDGTIDLPTIGVLLLRQKDLALPSIEPLICAPTPKKP